MVDIKKIRCCEFKMIEFIRHDDEFSDSVYRKCRELILNDKELWVQNRRAFVQYSACGGCRGRIKKYFHGRLFKYGLNDAQNNIKAAMLLNSVNFKIKRWYPKFIVRWLILRRLKDGEI